MHALSALEYAHRLGFGERVSTRGLQHLTGIAVLRDVELRHIEREKPEMVVVRTVPHRLLRLSERIGVTALICHFLKANAVTAWGVPSRGNESCDFTDRAQSRDHRGPAMASSRQRTAARRNVHKAAAAARRKKTISKLPKRTRTALGKQAAKVAKRKR